MSFRFSNPSFCNHIYIYIYILFSITTSNPVSLAVLAQQLLWARLQGLPQTCPHLFGHTQLMNLNPYIPVVKSDSLHLNEEILSYCFPRSELHNVPQKTFFLLLQGTFTFHLPLVELLWKASMFSQYKWLWGEPSRSLFWTGHSSLQWNSHYFTVDSLRCIMVEVHNFNPPASISSTAFTPDLIWSLMFLE